MDVFSHNGLTTYIVNSLEEVTSVLDSEVFKQGLEHAEQKRDTFIAEAQTRMEKYFLSDNFPYNHMEKPTFHSMVSKSMGVISKSNKGYFFLFVEGESIVALWSCAVNKNTTASYGWAYFLGALEDLGGYTWTNDAVAHEKKLLNAIGCDRCVVHINSKGQDIDVRIPRLVEEGLVEIVSTKPNSLNDKQISVTLKYL